jgi:hypothetical protein
MVDANMGIDASSSSEDFVMADDASCRFKRRRFGSSSDLPGIHHLPFSSSSTSSPFGIPPSSPISSLNPHGTRTSPLGDILHSKRTQEDGQTSIPHLQRIIDTQAATIDRLTSEKSSIETSFNELKAINDKTCNENKILKKAVSIQQERQHHAESEMEEARRFKAEADDKIRRLEQIILTLRYHLQAQQPCLGNDFMSMNQRPPDVF